MLAISSYLSTKNFSEISKSALLERSKYNWYTYDPSPLSIVIDDPGSFFKRLRKTWIAILNLLLEFNHRYGVNVYFSQEFIARKVNLTRSQVNRILKKLCSLGLIAMKYRHMQTCLYKISSFFFQTEIKYKYWRIFRPLRFMALDRLRTQLVDRVCSNFNIKTSYLKKVGIEDVVTNTIRNIKNIKLTKWGQIRVSCFPDDAIEYADIALGYYGGGVRDRFKLFTQICLDYCEMHGLDPDWGYSIRLGKKFGIRDDARMYFKDDPKRVVSNVVVKSESVVQPPMKRSYSIWRSPERVVVNKVEERRKIEVIRQSDIWRRFEALVMGGKAFVPPVPETLIKDGQ